MGPLKLHTDDPELHELRRSYLESPVYEYDVKFHSIYVYLNILRRVITSVLPHLLKKEVPCSI